MPREVYDGLEAVRRSGLTNMLDRPAVVEIAVTLGFGAAAEWIEANRGLYSRGVFCGFEAQE